MYFLNFYKLPICSVLDFPFSVSYSGYCRFESDKKDTIRELNTLNVRACYKECQSTKDCVAFAFDDDDTGNNCDLYRGGPYTYGNGREYTTCYIMPAGKFNRILCMPTLAKYYIC